MVFVMSFYRDSITKLFSHSCEIVGQTYFLISFSVEKLLSHVRTVQFEQICFVGLKLTLYPWVIKYSFKYKKWSHKECFSLLIASDSLLVGIRIELIFKNISISRN